MKENLLKLLMKVFKTKYAIVGVPAIITNSNGEILLGKRSKNHITYPSYWGLPGGVVEYGEKLEDAVKREVKEEMGVEIKIVKRCKNIYENLPDKKENITMHSIDFPYLCKITGGIPSAMDETDEVRWFKPAEIRKMKLAY